MSAELLVNLQCSTELEILLSIQLAPKSRTWSRLRREWAGENYYRDTKLYRNEYRMYILQKEPFISGNVNIINFWYELFRENRQKIETAMLWEVLMHRHFPLWYICKGGSYIFTAIKLCVLLSRFGDSLLVSHVWSVMSETIH